MEPGKGIAAHFKHKPTQDQQGLFIALEQFITDSEPMSAFVMKGYAGTGKTTVLSALVKALPAFGYRSVLLAPTGRAAKVLQAYTGKAAFTIHKKIYKHKGSNELGFQLSLAKNPHQKTIFIIDEASMIAEGSNDIDRLQFGNGILSDLIRFVYESGRECKLIFIGDNAQLPPVGSGESPALNKNFLEERFGLQVPNFELQEVMRQEKKSGILHNATSLRRLLSDEKELTPKLSTKGFKDFYSITGERLIDGINYAYDKYGIENTLIICRSNKNANLYNQNIRSRILYREEAISTGDQVMTVKNNYFWLPETSNISFIANGDTAKVIRIRGEQELYGFTFAEASLQFIDYPDEPVITAKVLLDTLTNDGPNLSYAEQTLLYEKIAEDYMHITNRKERSEKIKQDPYFNALQIKFAYAVTCHKSQGGQWKAVFIDQGYLTEEMINKEFIRWLYTAVTRAQSELFLVNFDRRFLEV